MSVAFPPYVASATRTIVVPQTAGVATRLSAAATVPPRWPAKSPSEALDHTLDLDAWLAEIDDTIVGVSVVIQAADGSVLGPTDLGIVWVTLLQGRSTVLLSGGRPGVGYFAAMTISTATGRRGRFLVSLQVANDDVAAEPEPQVPIELSFGALVLADGTPLLLAPNMPLLLSGGSQTVAGPVPLSPNVIMADANHALVLDDGTPLIVA